MDVYGSFKEHDGKLDVILRWNLVIENYFPICPLPLPLLCYHSPLISFSINIFGGYYIILYFLLCMEFQNVRTPRET
jgi:hypothetical protein